VSLYVYFKLWETCKIWKADSSKIGHFEVSPVLKISGCYYVWSQRDFGIKASYMMEEK